MELEAFSGDETSMLVKRYGTTVVRSYHHVSGVASPADDLVEKGRHQHSTGASPLPAGVDGHGEELAASAYSGSAGRSVSQGLQYPAPILDHRTGGAGSGLEPSCQRKLLYRPDTSVEPAMNPAGSPSHSAMIRKECVDVQILLVQVLQRSGDPATRGIPRISERRGGRHATPASAAVPARMTITEEGCRPADFQPIVDPPDRHGQARWVTPGVLSCSAPSPSPTTSLDRHRRLTACHNTWWKSLGPVRISRGHAVDCDVMDRGSERGGLGQYQMSHLQNIESQSIHIIREVAAEFERPVLLFSGGKDSVVMLRLAQKAFWPGRIPFPVMHIDTGHNFPEVIEFRDRFVGAIGATLVVASVQESIDAGRVTEETGPDPSRNRLQTRTLLDAISRAQVRCRFRRCPPG